MEKIYHKSLKKSPVTPSEVQEKTWKDITEGAIVMALKKITDISVRSNLTEYAFQNSPTLLTGRGS